MKRDWTCLRARCKPLFFAAVGLGVLAVAACTLNPATGEKQFAALMSPAQENSVGAQEHAKIMQTYGEPSASDPLQIYVSNIGKKLAAHTERSDVTYKFFLLDTPMMNAFALPGGYVYITRGILAAANNEAELASVLGHEIAHITARHSAERYSHGVLSSIGAMAVGIATNNSQVAQVANTGASLYTSSYSRKQESQSDELGIRYLSRAGYDPKAMASFLSVLEANDGLSGQLAGREGNNFSYFSTHPRTSDRVEQAQAIAASYPASAQSVTNHDGYLRTINGMVYGDSEKQGFVRGNSFYHPGMGFMFTVPNNFNINNQPEQVVVTSPSGGAILIFDSASNARNVDPATFIAQDWMKGQAIGNVETMDINGKRAATASFPGVINNQKMTVRIIAVSWDAGRMFRFQLAIPANANNALLDDLKRTTYSLRPLSAQERTTVKPYRLRTVTAAAGDSVASLSSRLPFPNLKEERFRVLNGLSANAQVVPGRLYKIVTD